MYQSSCVRDTLQDKTTLNCTRDRLSSRSEMLRAFTSHLSAMCRLSQKEWDFIDQLRGATKSHSPGRAWNDAASPSIVISGWACQQRFLSDGRRQIIRIVLPGDIIGNLDCSKLSYNSSVAALTPMITMDASSLVTVAERRDPKQDGLTRALRLLASEEMIAMQNQIVRLGCQSAYERIVHLMLELHSRLQAAGLTDEDKFAMPLTQETLADVLGLSLVHLNRTIRRLRRDGLLHIRLGSVTILDLKLTQVVADWMPSSYLPIALRNR